MKHFDEFWEQLHTALDEPVPIRNWTTTGRAIATKTFPAWSGKGTFARKLSAKASTKLVPTAIYCETLATENLRILNKSEAEKVYSVWQNYLGRRVTRQRLRELSQNLTYLISIFHQYQHLMKGGS